MAHVMHTARDLKTNSSKDFKECPAMFLSRSELYWEKAADLMKKWVMKIVLV